METNNLLAGLAGVVMLALTVVWWLYDAPEFGAVVSAAWVIAKAFLMFIGLLMGAGGVVGSVINVFRSREA